MRKLSLIISLTFVSFVALAWGGFEHAVIAYMAMEHLTPDAERNIRRYLDQPLYEYADWMDYEPIQYSEELGQLTRHSHLFTVNPDFTYAEESLCSNGECNGAPTLEFLVGALKEHGNLPHETVSVYLRCLIHLFGDFHCPGHIMPHHTPGGLEPEGSWRRHYMWKKCTYKGQKSSFHSLWDSALLRERAGWNYEDWRQYLDIWTAEQIAEATSGQFRDYLVDCARLSAPAFDWWTPGGNYDEGYYSGRVAELAHTLVAKAAYRLAHQLNEIFDYE